MKISEVFDVTTARPLHSLDIVGIAELAQFTPIKVCDKYPVAVAEDTIREEWSLEVDHYHELNYLDFNKATIWFIDGSSLTFAKKKVK